MPLTIGHRQHTPAPMPTCSNELDDDAMTVDPKADVPSTSGKAAEDRATAGVHRTLPAKYAVVLGLLGSTLVAAVGATVYTDTGPVPGLPGLDPLVRVGLPVIRVLLDLTALATVGLSFLPKLLGFDRPKHTEPIMSVARRVTVVTALLWMVCALLALLLQAAELNPGRTLTTTMVIDYVANVPAGPGLLMSAGGALACALFGLLAVRHGESVPAELRAIVAVLSLLPIPLTGHATDWVYHDFSMISMDLHVVAASVWTGGLAALAVFVAPRRGLLAQALPRFSRLATLSVCTVGISGAFNGIMELVITPGAGLIGLINTAYGQIVLAKIACLVALAMSGGHIRFRLMPRIARHQSTALIGWIALEVSIMGVAYGLGVVLARAPVIA
jgi:putative copper resistance protein D